MLSALRHHITELTADNRAMRYTFGLGAGSGAPVASSSKIAPDANDEGYQGSKAVSRPRQPGEVDLEAVVQRVKALVQENEELGDMVVEAGKASTEEWERTLEGQQGSFIPLATIVIPGVS